ncbi:MAG: tRNA 2-thiouridine(34) synthase MnmA [Gammaproteobacteria bacterium]|nr:tRNA 2-thiouridine(34) synthase MnmA [Gammaproteobacteria bacterium]
MSLKHIVVGLSGGVDSAIAAYLLKKAGHKIDAIFMKNWEEDDSDEYCSAAQDLEDAEKVCKKLGIPLRTVNFSSEYWDWVFEYFLTEHKAGRTPNPDVLCNTEIKFKAFLDFAIELGAEKIATGHYARCQQTTSDYQLLTAIDSNKDQSYFLHGLNQQQLSKSLFPLGDISKPQVRQLAEELNLHIHDKKDSTGICFIGERKFRDFLNQYIDNNQGDIVDTEGNVIGSHQGTTFFTIGQRQGLGIGGVASASEQPWYVVDKNMETNQLIVGQGSDHPDLFNSSLIIEEMHWIEQSYKHSINSIQAKIRYRQSHQACLATELKNGQWQLDFEQPQRAVTPGQYAVLYDNEHCLGGGIISQRIN